MSAEKNGLYSGLSKELLDVSAYVLRTCGLLIPSPDLTNGPDLTDGDGPDASNIVGWRGQSNPVLAVEAHLARPIAVDPLHPKIKSARMLVEDPDIAISITVNRNYTKGKLRNDDPTGLYILDIFKRHYPIQPV